jgi:hypothetical protein
VTDDRSNSALKPGSDINQPETGEAAVPDVTSADNPALQIKPTRFTLLLPQLPRHRWECQEPRSGTSLLYGSLGIH